MDSKPIGMENGAFSADYGNKDEEVEDEPHLERYVSIFSINYIYMLYKKLWTLMNTMFIYWFIV